MKKDKIIIMLNQQMPKGISFEEWETLWMAELKAAGLAYEYEIVEDDGTFIGQKLDDLAGNAAAVIGMVIREGMLDRAFFEKHRELKYIGTLSHGYAPLDQSLLHEFGVTVTNTAYGSNTVAQYTFSMLLDICNGISENNQYLKNEYWKDQYRGCATAYTYSVNKQIELMDKTIGIIGMGTIGYEVAKIANGFGMHIMSYSTTRKEGDQYQYICQTDRKTLLSRSDVISLNCPLNEKTKDIICKETIQQMKDGVIIINTARGGLIKEDDLNEALYNRKVYAAGLDVLCGEPLLKPGPLLMNPYAKITGHIAWMTPESCIRMAKLGIQHFVDYLQKKPTGVIGR